MTFQLPAVENKSACKFRKKSTLLLCSNVAKCSVAKLYSLDILQKDRVTHLEGSNTHPLPRVVYWGEPE